MNPATEELAYITAAGTLLAFGLDDRGVPSVTYWGAAPPSGMDDFVSGLGRTELPAVMPSGPDEPRMASVLPSALAGWAGAPALELYRGRRPVLLRLRLRGLDRTATSVIFDLDDAGAEVGVILRFTIDTAGTVRSSMDIVNSGEEPVGIAACRLLLPIPLEAREVVDLTGRWAGERQPQRGPIFDGARVRSAYRGRSGHDTPLLQMVGTRGFGFRGGEVWGAHVAWSGDSEYRIERLPEGTGTFTALMGGGEHLSGGEVVLSSGASYRSPDVVFVWSASGIDGLSERLHKTVRMGASYPRRPRPLTLNTWEAVYFDQNFERLADLARTAASVGVERFVLDDGWFVGRRDDTAGLGDWIVDGSVWPNGLEPLAALVHALRMEFGLWFEPEMVSPSSSVAQQHPEWILAPPGPSTTSWRNQYVLNLAIPEAFNYVFRLIDALIERLGLAFIKWDHNRDLTEPIDRRTGVYGVHEQTKAVYRLMDLLRERHPALEIESCASGGARVDLGVMDHAQRVWASDTNDAIERERIQEWTGVLLPPELIGSHLGPPRAHTTGRVLDLSFRLAVTLFAHAGIEWDISQCSGAELALLSAWAEVYKSTRGLIASGKTCRADAVPVGSHLHGVVAGDQRSALYAWSQTDVGPLALTPRIRIPGLDARMDYRFSSLDVLGQAARRTTERPWWAKGSVPAVFPGSLLVNAGLPLPSLQPGQTFLFHLVSVEGAS